MDNKPVYKDWKFWFKLIVGIIPLVAIVVFFFGGGAPLFNDPAKYWSEVFTPDRVNDFQPDLIARVEGWSKSQNIGYWISRNLFMFTTIANIMQSVFLINSAVHHRNEGLGKFDNWKTGIIVVNAMWWVILMYNVSLLFSGAISYMKWYNYVSWLCEHSVVPFLGIIYILFFYRKVDTDYNKKPAMFRFEQMIYSLLPLIIYFVVFESLGFILKATDAMPIFGDMSSTGWWPYEFMDPTDTQTRIHKPLSNAAEQMALAYVGSLAEQVAFFWVFYGISRGNMKVQYKREGLKLPENIYTKTKKAVKD
ncbi:hypothetical protein [Mesoplasma lactucae]|uniref:Uncharacterized protein n=1 Tax=Mesoplasma lactucae ATCC 49193 TaxID=81460 RepID=A0A291ISJ8_9MOLU|nr:hypothetical protein [Mesoplasma lactucae]ATG97686.1 hypothetical protein CP520_03020 [Mesoplasma lactucae ATCC 49193]ATZ19849.1 hypothetical protein MLACT_v1c00240 [Mesoplasma lactucae ATCC 49193]MCL8216712.1 hypothetical protein [Mesoplasma lactucae ATCC 49193]